MQNPGIQDRGTGRGQGEGVGLTSVSRLYLISYLRMSPLGLCGCSQRSRTLFLLAGSQVTFPGMLSASTGGGEERDQSRGGRSDSPNAAQSLSCGARKVAWAWGTLLGPSWGPTAPSIPALTHGPL